MADPAKSTDTYLQISSRLARFSPAVLIADHIGKDLSAGRTTLDGISFLAKDRWRLLTALRDAKDSTGSPAFAEGSKEDLRHWALRLSFFATQGIGFREIWRPRLSTRGLQMSDARTGPFAPKWDRRFSAGFGDSMDLPDLSSLHCAVARDACNIHIDQMGFVMTGPNGDPVVDPDFLRHTLVELLWKSKLKGRIPLWVTERFSFVIPSSPNDYSRLGLSLDISPSTTYKLTLTGSCTILGGFECSATLGLSGIW